VGEADPKVAEARVDVGAEDLKIGGVVGHGETLTSPRSVEETLLSRGQSAEG
jgi:hypothetical protein